MADKSRRFDQATAAYDAGDFETAFRIWRTLADENDLAAMRNAGHMLRKGLGVERDFERALDYYTEAARKGLVLAMANVAEMHFNGEGTLKDPEEAARWYALAANGGLSIAMVKLAELYEQGLGVPKDPERARALYERAARNGFVPAQGKVGQSAGSASTAPAPALAKPAVAAGESISALSLQSGMVIGKPVVEAGDRKRGKREPAGETPMVDVPPKPKAAAKPRRVNVPPMEPLNPAAAATLAPQDGHLLQAGWTAYQAGQQSDALRLWRGPAVKGVAEAQYRVGYMYERGQATGTDLIEAFRWYKLGAGQQNAAASAALERVSAQLSPAERAIAESLVAGGAQTPKP